MKMNFVWQLLFGAAVVVTALSAVDIGKKHGGGDQHHSHHKCEQSSGPKANCQLDLTVAVDMSWAMKSRKNVLNLANFTISNIIDQYAINHQHSRVSIQTLGSWAFSQSPYFEKFDQACKFISHAAETFPFFGNDFFQLSKVFKSYLLSNILSSPRKRVLVILTAINDPFNINAAIPLADLVKHKAHVVIVGINQKNQKYLERIGDDVIYANFNDYTESLADSIVSKTCPGNATTTSKPLTTTTTTTAAPATTTTTFFVEPTSAAATTESPVETTTAAEPQATSTAAEATTTLPQESTTSALPEQPTTDGPNQPSTSEPSEPSTTSPTATDEASTLQPEAPSTSVQPQTTTEAPSDAPSTSSSQPENPTTVNPEATTAAPETNEPSTLQPENPSTIAPQESSTPENNYSTEGPTEPSTPSFTDKPSSVEPSDLPSTFLPNQPTTDSPIFSTEVPTTSASEDSTTFNPNQPSTSFPEEPTTGQPYTPVNATTEKSSTGQPSTEAPAFTTESPSSSQPHVSSTSNPEEPSTSFTDEPSTDQPPTEAPVDGTTENPTSTVEPAATTTTDNSEQSTPETNDGSTTISQQTSATTEESSFTTNKPEGLSTENPAESSTPESENPTTGSPSTTAAAEESSTAKPEEPSTAAPNDGSTEEPGFSSTVEFNTPALPSVQTTVDQSETSATTQNNDASSDQPQTWSSTAALVTDEPSTIAPEMPSTNAPNTDATDEPSTALPTIEPEEPTTDGAIHTSTISLNQPSTPEPSDPSTQPEEPVTAVTNEPTTQMPEEGSTDNPENPNTAGPIESTTNDLPATEATSNADASTADPSNPSTAASVDVTTTAAAPEATSASEAPAKPSSEASTDAPVEQTTEVQVIDSSTATTEIPTEVTALPVTTENPLSDSLGSSCSTNTTGAWLDLVFVIDTSAVLTSTQLNQFGGLIAGLLRRFTIDPIAERSTRVAIITYTKDSVVQYDLSAFKDWSSLYSAFSSIGKFRQNEKVVDISKGLSAAEKILKSQESHRIPAIVLVGASTNTDSIPAAEPLSKQIIADGIKIVTINFAVNHDATEAPLNSLASSPSYGFVSNDPQLYSKLTLAFTKVNCVCPKLTYQFATTTTVFGDCVQGFNGQTPPDIAKEMCEMSGGILVSVTSQEKLDFIRTEVVKNVFGANPEFTIGLHRIPESDSKWFWYGYNGTAFPLGDFKKWEDGKAPADSAACGYAAREVSDNALAFAAGGCDYEDARPYLCQTKACDSNHFCDLQTGVKAANAHIKLQSEMKQRSFRSINNKRLY